MKTSKIELVKWVPDDCEDIEIDWPKVHKTIGLDQTNWLLKQSSSVCQLILERNDACCRLIAEFYDKSALVSYHLMWAK